MLIKAAECGIKPKEFWTLTWKEFQICVVAQGRKELNEWRKVRSLAHMIAMANGETKPLHIFWPLPGDPIEDRKPLSNEELANVFKLYN